MPSTAVNANASSLNVVVAAPGPTQKIGVKNYVLVAAGAVNATWQSGGNALSGAMTFAAAGGSLVASTGGTRIDPEYLFVTNPGEALQLNLSAAVGVNGHLAYDVFSA